MNSRLRRVVSRQRKPRYFRFRLKANARYAPFLFQAKPLRRVGFGFRFERRVADKTT